ncbi:MAG: hypothetical protein JWM95_5355 [Gemmatimonadetes bacterium]|nr:hypothetical protein [Gemmatimonadota bacterium]
MTLARLIGLAVLVAAAPLSALTANTLTTAEEKGGWKLLFDGKSFAGWRGLGYDNVPTATWRIVDGTIEKVPKANVVTLPDGQPAAGGDLMTIPTFTDFELAFEWKVPPGANSGVKYNVSEELSVKSANHAALGFEYQVLDDSLNSDNKIPTHRAGSLYDLITPNATKKLRPVGEWNSSRIIVRGNHGEHWLNGTIVVSYELNSPEFKALMDKSKYKSIPGFADHRAGHIVLQDHNDGAWFRNIKIREIKP